MGTEISRRELLQGTLAGLAFWIAGIPQALFWTVVMVVMSILPVIGSAIVIALGWGGLFTLYNMLAVNNFGLREIGRINGAISLMESVGVGLGSWVTGVLFDIYGSYQIAFIMLACCLFVSLVVGTQIKSEVDERSLAAPS